jgi:hypothetical protein
MLRGEDLEEGVGFYLTDIQIKNLKKVSRRQNLRYQSTSEGLLMNILKNSKRKKGNERR